MVVFFFLKSGSSPILNFHSDQLRIPSLSSSKYSKSSWAPLNFEFKVLKYQWNFKPHTAVISQIGETPIMNINHMVVEYLSKSQVGVPPALLSLPFNPDFWKRIRIFIRQYFKGSLKSYPHNYWIEVLWGQRIKLIQVISSSELHEYWLNNVVFIFFCPLGFCRASKASNLTASKSKYEN